MLGACSPASKLESRAWDTHNKSVVGHTPAIVEASHLASSLLKIAATFFDTTKSAAILTGVRFLRSRSRSNYLISILSWRVVGGLGRTSSGSSSAGVEFLFQFCNSTYTPCARH